MISMNSVLKRGCTTWDRDLLPSDEFEQRTRIVRASMAERSLDALICFGHAALAGNVAYLSGFAPPFAAMGVVLGKDGEPVLITGVGSRELPFMETLTPISQLRASNGISEGPALAVLRSVSDIARPGARLGVVGVADALTRSAYEELQGALSTYETVDADEMLTAIRAAKRPREIFALRRALKIAERAVDAALTEFAHGATVPTALLAAESVAFEHGGRDVRVLGDFGNGALSPVQSRSTARPDRLTVYCAVEQCGYWGQATGCSAASPQAASALAGMLDALAAGVDTGCVAREAAAKLQGGTSDVAFSYGLGGGIGLDLNEFPEISPDGAAIPTNAVMALQVITHESNGLGAAGVTVRVHDEYIEPL